jgi:hypothetical protein
MAVVAKTSVAVLITMFKVALKTRKGVKKLKQIANNAGVALDAKLNPDMYESTKEELLAKFDDRQKKRFYDAALDAMHRLVTAKGTRQSIGGYAFEISRAFNGIQAKELEQMYNEIH